jgi:2-oxoisovalerate dehydrogenase E2 component (dihydrolipoyl transacylase)
MTVFKLPDLGEGLSEAEVLRWHVKIGDRIEVDAPMLAVETAKAVVEVPSPVSGTILALHAQPGDRIEIGAPLIEFVPDASHAASSAPSQASTSGDAGTVVGHVAPLAEDYVVGGVVAAAPGESLSRLGACSAARALARSLGVELESLRGSGRDGVITLEDVIHAGMPNSSSRGSRHSVPASSAAPPELGGHVEPLRSLRRSMAQSMTLARDNVMASTVFDDADLHHWPGPGDYSARVLRAIANAVRTEPALNAWYDAAAESRTLFDHVDVGLAVDTPDGLLVPVIRHIEQLDASQLRAELDRLKRAARERTVRSDELRHFTFMLSNFGTLAGRYATPVVVPPAVAILGTGRVRADVMAVEGRVEIHRRMPLSLSFDHRVVTGAEAVRFLAAFIGDLERME